MRPFAPIGALGIAALLACALPGFAAPREPVKAIMDLAGAIWSNTAPEGADYFDKDHIGLFSTGFRAAYHEAGKQAQLEDGGVFEYDVITNSQDGCPLEDVSIASEPDPSGESLVKVTFRSMRCYDDDTVSEVHFKVVTENGRSVISDIDRIVDGKAVSLVDEMKDLVRQGATPPANQQEP